MTNGHRNQGPAWFEDVRRFMRTTAIDTLDNIEIPDNVDWDDLEQRFCAAVRAEGRWNENEFENDTIRQLLDDVHRVAITPHRNALGDEVRRTDQRRQQVLMRLAAHLFHMVVDGR